MTTSGSTRSVSSNLTIRLLQIQSKCFVSQDATAEFNEDETDDPDFLMNLERERQEREHEGLKGTLYEPSLVICWLVIAFVTLYVVIAVITGHPESTFKDEL